MSSSWLLFFSHQTPCQRCQHNFHFFFVIWWVEKFRSFLSSSSSIFHGKENEKRSKNKYSDHQSTSPASLETRGSYTDTHKPFKLLTNVCAWKFKCMTINSISKHIFIHRRRKLASKCWINEWKFNTDAVVLYLTVMGVDTSIIQVERIAWNLPFNLSFHFDMKNSVVRKDCLFFPLMTEKFIAFMHEQEIGMTEMEVENNVHRKLYF